MSERGETANGRGGEKGTAAGAKQAQESQVSQERD